MKALVIFRHGPSTGGEEQPVSIHLDPVQAAEALTRAAQQHQDAGEGVDWLNGVEFEVYDWGTRDTRWWYCLKPAAVDPEPGRPARHRTPVSRLVRRTP
jgi:hypothetical protein